MYILYKSSSCTIRYCIKLLKHGFYELLLDPKLNTSVLSKTAIKMLLKNAKLISKYAENKTEMQGN